MIVCRARLYRLVMGVVLLCGATAPALAQEIELCPTLQPCRVAQSVTVGVETRVALEWQGRAYVERVADIASDQGVFTLGNADAGVRLGAVSMPLRERVTAMADGQPVTFTLSEFLTVPARVSQRAAEQGASQIAYVRQFSVNGVTVTGVQIIRLSEPAPQPQPEPEPEPEPEPQPQPRPPAEEQVREQRLTNTARSLREGSRVTASGLLIRRVALRFEGGAPVASVGRAEPLRAQADIYYDRAGLLEAVWEVATPATTAGQPVYRRLENVRRYLGAGQQASLQSPLLPSEEAGLYLLRLRLIQPAFDREPLELRYQVSSQSAEPTLVPVLRVSEPVAGTKLGADTRFQWRPVANTHAYQLELYEQPPSSSDRTLSPGPDTAVAALREAPDTGMLVRGNTDSAQLSPAVLQRLAPGRTYHWRIIAVNAEGDIVAANAIQSIQTEE